MRTDTIEITVPNEKEVEFLLHYSMDKAFLGWLCTTNVKVMDASVKGLSPEQFKSFVEKSFTISFFYAEGREEGLLQALYNYRKSLG